MGNEFKTKNFELLEYPENSLVVAFDPSKREFFLFPDAIDILLESLGYELYYITDGKDFEKFSEEKKVEVNLIFKSYLDSSFLRIKSEFYFIPFETNLIVPLVSIKECYLIGDSYEENITDKLKKIIEFYPQKIDFFTLLELNYGRSYFSPSPPSNYSHFLIV